MHTVLEGSNINAMGMLHTYSHCGSGLECKDGTC